MEFGPRALGAHSILGDPRSPTMQRDLNLKVKYRESFRPFAPSVLREDVSDWFNLNSNSPYMLIVAACASIGAAPRLPTKSSFLVSTNSMLRAGNSGCDARRLLGPHPDSRR